MLDIKENRLNYGELLSPPNGFELVKAVGTTYSLDLYALLAIPVAMFYSKSLEGDFHKNRYDILDAIRQSKEKVDLFCQKGKILVPKKKYSNLLAFMEGCITEITPDIAFASFHPKLWVMRFEKDKEVLYRVVVLSRNLTFDRSWDIAYHADGKPQRKSNTQAQKLSKYLQNFYTTSGRIVPPAFFTDLEKVEFDIPNGFNKFEFFPILGFGNKLADFPNPLEVEQYDELLIISPFVDKTTLDKLSKNNERLCLISRREELDKLDLSIYEDIETYCMETLIVDGEYSLDTEGVEPLFQNLHAKIFIGKRAKQTDWYLGSANCSAPAFERNAEFLIKLYADEKSTSLQKIKENLLDIKKKFFCLYEPGEQRAETEEEKISLALRELNYYLCNNIYEGIAQKSSQTENYDVQVTANMKPWDDLKFSIKARLIHREEEGRDIKFGQKTALVFPNVALTNLSPFLILEIHYANKHHSSIVVKMDLDMPEEREEVIFNNLINSKFKFFQYLQFILSPEQNNNVLEIFEMDPNGLGSGEQLKQAFGMNAPIYEYLMYAASRTPKKLKEIDNIVTRLEKSKNDVATDFLPIWKVFKEFANE